MNDVAKKIDNMTLVSSAQNKAAMATDKNQQAAYFKSALIISS